MSGYPGDEGYPGQADYPDPAGYPGGPYGDPAAESPGRGAGYPEGTYPGGDQLAPLPPLGPGYPGAGRQDAGYPAGDYRPTGDQRTDPRSPGNQGTRYPRTDYPGTDYRSTGQRGEERQDTAAYRDDDGVPVTWRAEGTDEPGEADW